MEELEEGQSGREGGEGGEGGGCSRKGDEREGGRGGSEGEKRREVENKPISSNKCHIMQTHAIWRILCEQYPWQPEPLTYM